jgi:hypothetical protein
MEAASFFSFALAAPDVRFILDISVFIDVPVTGKCFFVGRFWARGTVCYLLFYNINEE